RKREHAYRNAISHQRHAKHGTCASDPGLLLDLVFGIVPGVDNVHCLALERRASDQASAPRLDSRGTLDGEIRPPDALARRQAIYAVLQPEHAALLGLTEPH